MTIQAGDKLPVASMQRLRDGKLEEISTAELFDNRKVVLFAVPGAFTPTCSEAHLPGFVKSIQAFRDLGIDVVGISVNDAFVMDAWAKQQGAPADLQLVADGNAVFTREMGLDSDASAYGMGIRSKRFALFADNGVVQFIDVEAPGEFRVSSAEHVLERLNAA